MDLETTKSQRSNRHDVRRAHRGFVVSLAALLSVATLTFSGTGGAVVRWVRGEVTSPKALSAGHWSCSVGTYYNVISGQLKSSTSLTKWTLIGKTGDALNALAYAPASHNMIAIDAQPGPNFNKLVQIAPNGARTIVGYITNMGKTGNWTAGDVDPATGYYYVSRGGAQLTKVNLATLVSSPVTLPVGVSIGNDIVIQRGWMWTVLPDRLLGFSLSSGATKFFLLPKTEQGLSAGSMWSTTIDKFFFRWNKTGVVYSSAGLRTASAVVTKVGVSAVANTTAQDGTTCVPTTILTADDAPELHLSGNFPSPLSPGRAVSIDVHLVNDYPSPVVIPASALRIALSSSVPACAIPANFVVRQGIPVAVTVPAHANTSLSALHVARASWPIIAMIDTHANQNVCANITLNISYSWRYSG